MQPLPHVYFVRAGIGVTGHVELESGPRVQPLASDSPPEFDGPDDLWSPETLLVAAAADCLLITFRGIARARRVGFQSATCAAEGWLERVDGVLWFTRLHLNAYVQADASASPDEIRHVMEKAKQTCLITNSLKATTTLDVTVDAETRPDAMTAADSTFPL